MTGFIGLCDRDDCPGVNGELLEGPWGVLHVEPCLVIVSDREDQP